MKNIDELIKEVENNERQLRNTKNEIGDAIFRIYNTYLYSIDKHIRTFFKKRRKIGKFIIKTRWHGGDEYSDGEPAIKIYYKRKLILKMSGREDDSSRTWQDTKFRLRHIYKFDTSRIAELQELHNSLVIITQEQLHKKNSRINQLNNFQLALKELEV